jgi:hypothetical protein
MIMMIGICISVMMVGLMRVAILVAMGCLFVEFKHKYSHTKRKGANKLLF